jgi:hypothetical protein
MKITIHDQKKIHEIQKEFSKQFPNLKLDFFESHEKAKHLLLHPTHTIGECRKVHLKGDLHIEPHMKICELKQGLHDTFGLHTEVYRKVGNDWLETATETWSLEKQNGCSSETNSESTLEVV